jgi:hypothetical protein
MQFFFLIARIQHENTQEEKLAVTFSEEVIAGWVVTILFLPNCGQF